MPDPQPDFQPYPAQAAATAPGPGATDWVIVYTVTSDAPQGRTSIDTSEPMTGTQALAEVEAIMRGKRPDRVTVDETCEVIQISPREVIVRRVGFFSTITTRVEIGRRPAR